MAMRTDDLRWWGCGPSVEAAMTVELPATSSNNLDNSPLVAAPGHHKMATLGGLVGERGSILLSRPLPRQPNCVEGLGARLDVELLLDGRPATKRWHGGHSSKVCSWWWPLICSQPRRRRATRLRVKAQPSGQQRLRTPFSPWGVVCVNFPALSEGVLQVKTMSWLLRTSGSGTRCCILLGGVV
uniref:Uncharacterized protein n=1 Tax=Oryza meridionalis TaxID=40149 RepID=A0A0E0DP69_9ORYZ